MGGAGALLAAAGARALRSSDYFDMVLETRGFAAMSASVMKGLASLDASLSLRAGIFRPPGVAQPGQEGEEEGREDRASERQDRVAPTPMAPTPGRRRPLQVTSPLLVNR